MQNSRAPLNEVGYSKTRSEWWESGERKKDSGLTWTPENWAASDRLRGGPGDREEDENRGLWRVASPPICVLQSSHVGCRGTEVRSDRESTKRGKQPGGQRYDLPHWRYEALCPNTVARIHLFIAVDNKQGGGLELRCTPGGIHFPCVCMA